MKHLPYFLLLFVLVLGACKGKDPDPEPAPKDPRNKYVGPYDMELRTYTFNMATQTSSSDSAFYTAWVLLGESAWELQLPTAADRWVVVELDSSSGNLYGPYPRFSGHFSDSGTVSFSSYSGGLGGGTSYAYTGVKSDL